MNQISKKIKEAYSLRISLALITKKRSLVDLNFFMKPASVNSLLN